MKDVVLHLLLVVVVVWWQAGNQLVEKHTQAVEVNRTVVWRVL